MSILCASFYCGDFCGDSSIVSRQLGANRSIQSHTRNSHKRNVPGSKSLKTRVILAGTLEPLLISGLQVRVLGGSPLLFNNLASSDFLSKARHVEQIHHV